MAPEQEGGEPVPASDQYAYATQHMKKVVHKTPTRDLSSMPSTAQNKVDARFTDIHRYRRPVGLVTQSDSTQMGAVIVSTYPVTLCYSNSEEELFNSLFTS